MPAIVNTGWLNQNALRAYPLSEEATRRDSSDSYTLPDDFLVDFVLPVNSALEYEPGNFYVSQITIFGTSITVEFAYWTGSAKSVIGSISIQVSTFTHNRAYLLNGDDDFEGVVGKVVVGNIDTVLLQVGSFAFNLAGGRLEPSVIVPDIRGVTGFRVLDGDDIGELFQGDIAFEAGDNFRITRSNFSGVTVLTLNAIDGEGTIAECVCVGDEADEGPIRTVNGVPPDSQGNINLIGDDCLVPEPQADENSIKITDVCSKPCCGCPELDTLVDDQKRVRDEIQTLVNFAARLEGSIATMQVMMSMLGPCTG
jgi:hypothetical protein